MLPSILPGLALNPNRSVFLKALPSLINKPVRPANPAIGLSSVTCSPELMMSKVNLDRASASTWCGWAASLLNLPALNISRLATARPSLLLYVRPLSTLLYFHEVPAPASSSTETRKRSRILRHRSDGSTEAGQLSRRSPILSLPPTLKCCQRPCGGIAV